MYSAANPTLLAKNLPSMDLGTGERIFLPGLSFSHQAAKAYFYLGKRLMEFPVRYDQAL